MFNEFNLKVVYNRSNGMFSCISSDWCTGKTDSILFETDSNCESAPKTVISQLKAYFFDKLIDEIQKIIDDEKTWGKPRYKGNYIAADYDCGVNRDVGIRIHDFDTYRKGHYVKCDFQNRWGRWEYGD